MFFTVIILIFSQPIFAPNFWTFLPQNFWTSYTKFLNQKFLYFSKLIVVHQNFWTFFDQFFDLNFWIFLNQFIYTIFFSFSKQIILHEIFWIFFFEPFFVHQKFWCLLNQFFTAKILNFSIRIFYTKKFVFVHQFWNNYLSLWSSIECLVDRWTNISK